MSDVINRYASAIRSGNLKSDPKTRQSDSDVVHAVGHAGRAVITNADGTKRRGSPLGAALLRLLVGDNNQTPAIVGILSEMAIGKASSGGNHIARPRAVDIASAVLAWHRYPACKVCKGHGVMVIRGTTTLGDETCPTCHGDGRIPFDRQFPIERIELARWLSAKIERELGVVAPEAMRMLSADMDF